MKKFTGALLGVALAALATLQPSSGKAAPQPQPTVIMLDEEPGGMKPPSAAQAGQLLRIAAAVDRDLYVSGQSPIRGVHLGERQRVRLYGSKGGGKSRRRK